MRVFLVDGTYELFRHYFGRPPRSSSEGGEVGAVLGVLTSLVSMLADGATHIGVATDHVIESFRNGLWPGYKDGSGVAADLLAQFTLLEHALSALGLQVWPMEDLEADDALASAASVLSELPVVEQILICSPDKDLAQCVRGDRVVQLDRRSGRVSDDAEVKTRFGVQPATIPDWLALVGDSADGFPGLLGWGKRSAAVVLGHYLHLEDVPHDAKDWNRDVLAGVRGAYKLAETLRRDRDLAFLFRDLATLRIDPAIAPSVEGLAWRGPTSSFHDVCAFLRSPDLYERVARLAPDQ